MGRGHIGTLPSSQPSNFIPQLLRARQPGVRFFSHHHCARSADKVTRMNESVRSDVLPLVKGGAVVALCGLAASFLHPASKLPGAWGHFSDVLGITYTLAWSYSFYPQFILNFKRKCVLHCHSGECETVRSTVVEVEVYHSLRLHGVHNGSRLMHMHFYMNSIVVLVFTPCTGL
jgi:hypothetical protein